MLLQIKPLNPTSQGLLLGFERALKLFFVIQKTVNLIVVFSVHLIPHSSAVVFGFATWHHLALENISEVRNMV